MLKITKLYICYVSTLTMLLTSICTIQAASLPDTGQSLCYDGTNMVACDADNTGDAATYPGQDGRYGRDAAATAGQLSKIGGGEAGFDYTRVCNSGELAGQGSCPADPALGSDPNDWACTKDNLTGLIWEVKLDDIAHLRHKGWTYTWYNSDVGTNAGNAGTPDAGSGSNSDNCLDDARCDTEKYTADVNTANLCGNNTDWRMPSKRELQTITHLGRTNPAIDPAYFPNTPSSSFWSASSLAYNPGVAWRVYFSYGDGYEGVKSYPYRVRLVRGGQF